MLLSRELSEPNTEPKGFVDIFEVRIRDLAFRLLRSYQHSVELTPTSTNRSTVMYVSLLPSPPFV
jgi:predicted component of type VI protein secretion system